MITDWVVATGATLPDDTGKLLTLCRILLVLVIATNLPDDPSKSIISSEFDPLSRIRFTNDIVRGSAVETTTGTGGVTDELIGGVTFELVAGGTSEVVGGVTLELVVGGVSEVVGGVTFELVVGGVSEVVGGTSLPYESTKLRKERRI